MRQYLNKINTLEPQEIVKCETYQQRQMSETLCVLLFENINGNEIS